MKPERYRPTVETILATLILLAVLAIHLRHTITDLPR